MVGAAALRLLRVRHLIDRNPHLQVAARAAGQPVARAAPPAAAPRRGVVSSASASARLAMAGRPKGAAPAEVLPETPAPGGRRRHATAALAVDDDAAVDEAAAAPAKRRRALDGAAAVAAAAAAAAAPTPAAAAASAAAAAPAPRRRRAPDPLPCADPTPALLQSLRARAFAPGPLPVPNLGYACLNTALRDLRPSVFTSRDCIKRTLDARGPAVLGELALANCRDLARLVQWNHEAGVRFFRMSSVLWPWMGTFKLDDVPGHAADIRAALALAGGLARAYGQRLTFHPSHFVKLGAPDAVLVAKSAAELEAHSQILDLMGYEVADPTNKINIHVGGVYGDKAGTLARWAAAYRSLSPRCRARVTVENDDAPGAFSVEDLLGLHAGCGVPIVFDFHHHRFCPGSLTEEAALRAAVATWPRGVRPVVHWSESQAGRRPHAHSDYVRGPINLYGLEKDVDVMIEAKQKERALLCLRDGLPVPVEPLPLGAAPAPPPPPPPPAAAGVALRLL